MAKAKKTTGQAPTTNVAGLFVNNVSIGTCVKVLLEGGQTVRGTFLGVVRGLILVDSTFINPRDIVAFKFD
jgi:hypothetical protein